MLGGALASFFESCSEADLDYFLKELLGNAIVDHKPLKDTIDIVFQGKILTLLKVLVFAVEVNYSDFLGGLQNTLATQAVMRIQSTSKTS